MLSGGEIEINQSSFFHNIRLSFVYVSLCIQLYTCMNMGGREVKKQVLIKATLYKIQY